jgi:hypothetical protein
LAGQGKAARLKNASLDASILDVQQSNVRFKERQKADLEPEPSANVSFRFRNMRKTVPGHRSIVEAYSASNIARQLQRALKAILIQPSQR